MRTPKLISQDRALPHHSRSDIPVPERQKTVFISCGQYARDEKELGKLACGLVEEITPFKAYFAEYQTTLKALSENVLSRLYESVGLIAIMHHRGGIEGRDI